LRETKRNIDQGLTKKEKELAAKKRKNKKITLFKKNLGINITFGDQGRILGIDENLRKKLDNAQVQFRRQKLNTEGS